MKLEIRTPEQSLYEGEVSAVKLPGSDGSFEILNDHAPIIASLQSGEIRIKTSEGDQFFKTGNGFVEVLKNEVVVLVESSGGVTQQATGSIHGTGTVTGDAETS